MDMGRKTSVYFGPPLEALTSNLTDEYESVSSRLNRTAERYLEIVKRHDLGLTDEERVILGNCLSGSWAEPLRIHHLADEVANSRWSGRPAAKTLFKKLQHASFADLVATVERLGF